VEVKCHTVSLSVLCTGPLSPWQLRSHYPTVRAPSVFQTCFESGRTEKNSFLCQDTSYERPAVSLSLQWQIQCCLLYVCFGFIDSFVTGSVRGLAAWWTVNRQICIHFEWISPVNESRCVNMLRGNSMQHMCRAHAQQTILFSEHLILTVPVTWKQTCIVFYTLKLSLPVARVRIKFFSVNRTGEEWYLC
jgi:hypothetical protein